MNNRIREVRKAVNLNQTDFGNRIGVKQTTIAGYETGAKNPLDSIILAICKEFNVSEHWLRTGEGEMFNELTEQEKIMYHTKKLFKDNDSIIVETIKDFIVIYDQLDSASKKILDDSIKKVLKDIK